MKGPRSTMALEETHGRPKFPHPPRGADDVCRRPGSAFRHLWAAALLWLGLLLPGHADAAKAHDHGAARLDIAVEGNRITLQMETPLDNLLGFERAPRTAAERKAADALVSALNAADALFKPDPAAQCSLRTVELASAALKLGRAEVGAKEDGHADLDANIEFECKDAAKATFIDVTMFNAFPRMKRIDIQAVTARGQFKRTLVAPARRVNLGR